MFCGPAVIVEQVAVPKKNMSSKIQGFKDFFHEVGEELRKCIWPTKNELIQSTMVVVVSVLLLAAFVGFCDFVLMKILRFVIPS
jgi:preprotein translocase subunit SecE